MNNDNNTFGFTNAALTATARAFAALGMPLETNSTWSDMHPRYIIPSPIPVAVSGWLIRHPEAFVDHRREGWFNRVPLLRVTVRDVLRLSPRYRASRKADYAKRVASRPSITRRLP